MSSSSSALARSSSSPVPASSQHGSVTKHEPSVVGSVLTVPTGIASVSQGGGSSGTTQQLFIRIQNMTATANLGVKLDLKKIALRCRYVLDIRVFYILVGMIISILLFRNTEYNPKRFAAVIMRLMEPKATGLIFASGKLVVTGLKSSHNASLAAKTFAYIIEKVDAGFQPMYVDFKVQNIVGTVDVGFPIRLEGLVYTHSKFASYEPELFSGLIYRLGKPRVVFMIFVSGKVIITGAKTEADMTEAMSKIYPVLVEYRKGTIQTPFAKGGVPVARGDATAKALANDNLTGLITADGANRLPEAKDKDVEEV